MGIFDKIEDIRRKPEHIRMRYVWFFVVISMLFILIIWFFSIKSRQTEPAASTTDLINPDIINQFQDQKKSLEDTSKQLKDVIQDPNLNNQ